jgi:hypothetical protein
MKLPLLLPRSMDYGQFYNWALLLPPICILVKLTTFVAACTLSNPQRYISSFILAKANLARASVQLQSHLSLRQLSRICASSGITDVLTLRLTIPPRKFYASQRSDNAGIIRCRVGGLRLLASLAPQDLYPVDDSGHRADVGCGIKYSASAFSDVSSFSSCASSDETSSGSGMDGRSINCECTFDCSTGGRAKRVKE